jgi:hypothetical protein
MGSGETIPPPIAELFRERCAVALWLRDAHRVPLAWNVAADAMFHFSSDARAALTPPMPRASRGVGSREHPVVLRHPIAGEFNGLAMELGVGGTDFVLCVVSPADDDARAKFRLIRALGVMSAAPLLEI